MTVAWRFIAGFRDPRGCVPEGRLNSERGRLEIFRLESIRQAGLVEHSSNFKRSRDADHI
jgi:hypothetical protein